MKMTRLEAISELSEMKTDAWIDERQMKALTMAIQSMKAIEDIMAEIEFERDRKIGGKFFEAVQYKSFNKCLEIIDKHIGRGEDNVEQ